MSRIACLRQVPAERRAAVADTLAIAGWEAAGDACEWAEDYLRVVWLDSDSCAPPCGPDWKPAIILIADSACLRRNDWPKSLPLPLVPWPADPVWLGIAADQALRSCGPAHPRAHPGSDDIELREALRRARAMSDAKSTFIASISHELRTPMNAVIGYSGLLMEMGLEGEAEAYVHSVYTSANHLLTLINDVLDFSRIEAGELHLEQTPFSVHECIESAIEILSGSAQDKGLALTLSISQVPSNVVGDPTRLRQIVLNLLSNACKFTDRGEVRVDVDLKPAGGRLGIRIEVSDTGIGMEGITLARLFKPFRQGDDSMNRRYGGSGLGLSICKRLVDLHSGTVEAHSALGAGSRFVVNLSLPISDVVERADVQPTAAASVIDGVAGLRILVVEDNLVNQWLLMLQIESLGGSARPASNGNEALRLLARETFDVVFMDIEMPEMDGIETTLRMRREERFASQRPYVVAATAHVLADSRRRVLDAGMDDFLSKPVLIENLREVLARAALARASRVISPPVSRRGCGGSDSDAIADA